MFSQSRSTYRISITIASATLLVAMCIGCNRDPNVRKQKYLQSGDNYAAEGKLKEALIQYSNALRIDANFAEAHYALSKVFIRMGNPVAAYTELSKTVDLRPNNLAARVDLGTVELAGDLPEKAEEQAKTVVSMDPNFPDAYALLANIANVKGNRAEALTQVQHALSLAPNRAAFHAMYGTMLASDPKDNAAARAELEKAIALDNNALDARLALASLFESVGDRNSAEQQYLAAIKTAPTNVQARASLAGLYIRAGLLAKAEESLHHAVNEMSDNALGVNLLKRFYIETNQRGRLEPAYADLLKEHSKSFAIKSAYARILVENGNYDKARPLAEELTKNNATDPQVEILNAALLLHDGKFDESFEALQTGVKENPGDPELQMALGNLALIKDDKQLAQASFSEAARLDTTDTAPLVGLAEVAQRRGDWMTLSQIAARTIKQHPEYADGYRWRGNAEANQNQDEKAEADLQTALRMNPNNSDAYTSLGQMRLRRGNLQEASALFEKALEKDPSNQTAVNALASMDVAAKNPGKALARLQAAVAASPNDPALYDQLGELQFDQGDYPNALANAVHALNIDHADLRATQVAAMSQTRMGQVDQAIAIWTQWNNTHPGVAAAEAALAQLEQVKGDKAQAIAHYRKSLQIDPALTVSANNLAYLLLETGQSVDEALSYAQTARRGLPTSPSTADTLAWVYYYKGRYAYARDLLESAAKTDASNASVQYHLGMTYSKLGDKAAATAHLRKAASLAPNDESGKEAAAALTHL